MEQVMELLVVFRAMEVFRYIFAAIIAFTVSVCAGTNDAAVPADFIPPLVLQQPGPLVELDYFYDAGCAACKEVETVVLPDVLKEFQGKCSLKRHEINDLESFKLLSAYESHFQVTDNEPVSIVVDCRVMLRGAGQIRAELRKRVEAAVNGRQQPGWQAETNSLSGPAPEEKLRSFTVSQVMVNGLADGINPCAIATLVFFMSVLAVARVTGWRLALIGGMFCAGSFIAYVLLGLGLLKGLHLMKGYPYIRQGLDVVMVLLLVVAAGLSFRDAWNYRRTGRPGDITLKLPGVLMKLTHSLIRNGVSRGVLPVSGFILGVLVTGIESVCTGQVYVPTMVIVIKSCGGEVNALAWRYLLLYNAMFVVPVIGVLVLVLSGLRTDQMVDWSRRNVVLSKVLLGSVLLALAVGILVW